MAAHKASLDIFDEAGMERLHVKGKLLSDYVLFIIDYCNSISKQRKMIEVITPARRRCGCQVSMLMLKNGKKYLMN